MCYLCNRISQNIDSSLKTYCLHKQIYPVSSLEALLGSLEISQNGGRNLRTYGGPSKIPARAGKLVRQRKYKRHSKQGLSVQ
jgi:hypothetical protein